MTEQHLHSRKSNFYVTLLFASLFLFVTLEVVLECVASPSRQRVLVAGCSARHVWCCTKHSHTFTSAATCGHDHLPFVLLEMIKIWSFSPLRLQLPVFALTSGALPQPLLQPCRFASTTASYFLIPRRDPKLLRTLLTLGAELSMSSGFVWRCGVRERRRRRRPG